MSGICGWVGELPGSGAAAELIGAMGRLLSRFDRTTPSLRHGDRFALAVSAPPRRAHLGAAHGYVAAIWGTPRFTDKELAQRARDAGPSLALIDAMRRLGPACCRELSGAFALAIVHEASGEALLAIDRMGIHNLSYRSTPHALVFGSTADAIGMFPGVQREIDWQSVYHYVHFHIVPGQDTAFRAERRLLPGQYLHVQNGQLQLHHYWRMRFDEHSDRPFGELREEFLSTLTGAVRRMSMHDRTGSFLSGGTDSSTVSGLLGQVTGKPADTFSIGFAERGYDEMEYARIAARHFKTQQHEYYVTPADIVDAIPKLAAIYDQPFGNSSAVPTYCCAKFAAESGMKTLLGGDGGDELFGGNERYATQSRFAQYERIPQSIRCGMLEPLARTVPGAALVPPIRWYRRLIELASMPMPDRMEAHNLLVRMGPANIFTSDMLGRIDLEGPRRLMHEVYQATNADSLINKMLAYDFRFTLADNDLPKVVRSCELAGLPVEFPMLDDELVSFSAGLEPAMKLKGTKLRYFFKEALRGFLPDEIITKTKHGFGLPFGWWLKTHKPLQELVTDALSSLRRRGFVRGDFVEQLMGRYLAEHPGYYGTMAWVLMMLELWMRQHYDCAGGKGVGSPAT